MLQVNAQELFDFLTNRWHSRLCPVTIILSGLFAAILWLGELDTTQISHSQWITIAILAIAFLTYWVFSTRLPRTPNDRVGFLLAIDAETKDQAHTIRQDFVLTLREMLLHRETRHRYAVLELPPYHVRKILADPHLAVLYGAKTRTTFMLFGRARQRQLQGQDTHVLQLQGMVAHGQIPTRTSKELAREFAAVLPRRWFLSEDNDLLTFEFTAQWTALVAQYIIGIAAYLSYDFAYAEELFQGLRSSWKPTLNNIPQLRKISNALPKRLADVYSAQAFQHYKHWQNTRKHTYLQQMKTYIDRLRELDPSNYPARLLMAIYHFVLARDIPSAMAEIRSCKRDQIKDVAWRYSYAFLFAYRGDVQQAMQQYKIASRSTLSSNTVIDVEDFILWVLDEEPDKVQLHFSLGMINLHVKVDPVRALDEFSAYVRKTEHLERQQHATRQYARNCIGSLRAQL